MMFVLSKLVAFACSPANWILALLIVFLFVKKERLKKKLGYVLLTVILVFTNPLLYRQVSLWWQPRPVKLEGRYTAAILPGGLSGYDKNGRGYFGPAADRFIQAANLYHSGKVERIIVTGGNGHLERKYPPEAHFLRDELVRNGVPADRILVEDRSRNTRQNAVFTRALADSLGLRPPFVLVTSATHMRRCHQEFKRAGIDASIFPCDYEVIDNYAGWHHLFLPQLQLPDAWGRLIKEWLGWLVSTW